MLLVISKGQSKAKIATNFEGLAIAMMLKRPPKVIPMFGNKSQVEIFQRLFDFSSTHQASEQETCFEQNKKYVITNCSGNMKSIAFIGRKSAANAAIKIIMQEETTVAF